MTILKLSKESFLKAKAFIFEQARPLEQALFQYHFENGSTEEVIFRLNQFQNNDGGFGNALEPDIRLPQSSVIATTIGLQILREINTDTKAIEVQNAIKYLLKQYDPSINAWHNVSQIVNNYPHAPWWTFKTEHGLTYSERFQPNSGAEILAHFWHYDGLIEDK
jgi:hypothetical protein